MVASQVACEAIWMRKILVGLFGQQMDLTVIYFDNQSRIKLSEIPVFHDRSKNNRYLVSLSQRLCIKVEHVVRLHSHEGERR